MTVIFGDFDLPETSWGGPLSCHTGHDLDNSSVESALSQHVDKLMRGDNTLDLILWTNDAFMSNVDMGPEFSISDHKIVLFDINLVIYNENVIGKVYAHRKDDYERLWVTLSETDRSCTHHEANLNGAWNKIHESIKQCHQVVLASL